MQFQLAAPSLDFYVDVRLGQFDGRWLAVADIEQQGLVEAVGRHGDQQIVVAVHPMTRSPAAVADAVLAALA